MKIKYLWSIFLHESERVPILTNPRSIFSMSRKDITSKVSMLEENGGKLAGTDFSKV